MAGIRQPKTRITAATFTKSHGLQYCDLTRKDLFLAPQAQRLAHYVQQPSTISAENEPITRSTYVTRADSIGAFFRNQIEAMGITAVDTFLSPTEPVPLHRVERCGIEFGGRIGWAVRPVAEKTP
jgi:hypothetical protein